MSELCRLLTTDDVDAFEVIRLRGCREEPASFLEAYEELTDGQQDFKNYFKNGWIAGAFIEGVLVGVSGIYIHRGIKVKHKGTVWGVYVVPEARGRALAKKLIAMLLDEAKKAGLELIMLSTDVTNPYSIAVYQGLGFAECGMEPRILKLADGSYVDDVVMIKHLT